MDMLREKPEYVVVPRPQAMLIDKVVDKLKNNNSGLVESEDDWEAVVMLFDLFRIEHPEHFAHFVETMKQYRYATSSTNAIIKDGEGDMVQHMLEVPEKFHQYMHYMFPNQKWEKKFIMKLTRVLPVLKVTDNL